MLGIHKIFHIIFKLTSLLTVHIEKASQRTWNMQA